MGISLKEIKETNYWIRMIIEIMNSKNNWEKLEKESKELMCIIEAINSKTARKHL